MERDNRWLPPIEPECPEDRDLQADWLIEQMNRLPLSDHFTQKDRLRLEAELAYEWDMMRITPKEIQDFIDGEVGYDGKK